VAEPKNFQDGLFEQTFSIAFKTGFTVYSVFACKDLGQMICYDFLV